MTEVFIQVKGLKAGDDIEKEIFYARKLSPTCEGKVVLARTQSSEDAANGFYFVRIEANCLNAALHIFDVLKRNQHLEVALMLPVPAMTGSNQ